MILATLIVLLFLLGFGFMLFSQAHREINPLNRKVGSFISVFIIIMSAFLILYFGGYFFTRTIIAGEDPFQLGGTRSVARLSEMEKNIFSLNAQLQKQAMDKVALNGNNLENELAAIFIVSEVALVEGEADLSVVPSTNKKCERCWRMLPTVGEQAAHPALCLRCAESVG